jgi:hypothetical protein
MRSFSARAADKILGEFKVQVHGRCWRDVLLLAVTGGCKFSTNDLELHVIDPHFIGPSKLAGIVVLRSYGVCWLSDSGA